MTKATCGLDIASTSACVSVQTADGRILHELEVPSSPAGEKKLLGLLPAGTAIFMESTGRYHLTWARSLSAAGYPVYVLNALLAKRLLGTGNALRQNKTDRIDARELARIGQMHGAGLQTYRFEEDAGRLRLRTLCQVRVRQRHMLTDTIKSAMDTLETMLPGSGLELAQSLGAADLFLKIEGFAQLQRMRSVTLQSFVRSKAEALHASLREPRVPAAIFDALLPALQAQLRLMALLRKQQQVLDTEVEEAVTTGERAADVALVRTIPGYGQKTAPIIVSCLPPDLRAWGPKQKVARKIQAYFGCDPKQRQSGQWHGRVTMSKRGSGLARTALFQAASCSLLHDPEMKAAYDRKRAEGKFYLICISHVMRLMLRRLVAVLYDRKPFVRHSLNLIPAA